MSKAANTRTLARCPRFCCKTLPKEPSGGAYTSWNGAWMKFACILLFEKALQCGDEKTILFAQKKMQYSSTSKSKSRGINITS